jgi:hypothetical protein
VSDEESQHRHQQQVQHAIAAARRLDWLHTHTWGERSRGAGLGPQISAGTQLAQQRSMCPTSQCQHIFGQQHNMANAADNSSTRDNHNLASCLVPQTADPPMPQPNSHQD